MIGRHAKRCARFGLLTAAALLAADCTSQNRSEVSIDMTDVRLRLSIQRYGCSLSDAVVFNYGTSPMEVAFQLHALAPDDRTIQLWSARCDPAVAGGSAGCRLNLDRTYEPTGGLGCPGIAYYRTRLMSAY